jgi:hypothetical protein
VGGIGVDGYGAVELFAPPASALERDDLNAGASRRRDIVRGIADHYRAACVHTRRLQRSHDDVRIRLGVLRVV